MSAQIRTIFARIRTAFVHLIIGCEIRYPKIGNLRYVDVSKLLPDQLSVLGDAKP